MRNALEFLTSARRLVIMGGVALVLAGCTAAIEEDVGQCEPGVEDISKIGDITPAGC